ncbi:integumentary mucin A.1-like [Macrobrachium rosenbergii]|uniref:integumentary mucin A.1-like n=1 Tax=Macrobrachium rosenbergii TaxID=79674 RepID=UPI0034D474A9
MGVSWLTVSVVTVFWAIVGIPLPLILGKGPNKGVTQVVLVITAATGWLFWVLSYLHQMNPLIGPQLHAPTVLALKYLWDGTISIDDLPIPTTTSPEPTTTTPIHTTTTPIHTTTAAFDALLFEGNPVETTTTSVETTTMIPSKAVDFATNPIDTATDNPVDITTNSPPDTTTNNPPDTGTDSFDTTTNVFDTSTNPFETTTNPYNTTAQDIF